MKLGWKELVRMKGRFGWMTIVTMLIVLLILMITGLADGLAYDNGAAVRNLPVEQFALSKDAEGQLTRSFLQADETPKGAEALGVQNMVLEKKNKTKDDVTVFALSQTTKYGPKQLQSLQKGEVLVDAAYAEQRGTRVGDTITDFRTKETFQIAGTVTDGRYSHAPVLWMTDESWQAWQSKMGASYVSAYIGQSLQTDQAVFSKQAVVENVPGYAAEQNSFQMMRVALVVIGALILTAFFYILTMQKMKQLGVLKAIGIRTRTMGASLLVQVVILTSLAFGVSVAITYLTSRFLPTDLPFRFEWSTSLMYGGILLVTAILGALVPLRMVKKLEAADAMGGMNG